MLVEVMGNVRDDLNVLRAIVGPHLVLVVNELPLLQPPSEHLLGDYAVFVSVPANICQMMIMAHADEDVSI